MKFARLALATCSATLMACSDSNDNRPDEAPPGEGPGTPTAYEVTVHRTDGGIPHIVAKDWASLGYGTAYAVAEDHYCAQARNILKFRAQLSENFGAGGGNRDSDLFYRLMIDTGLYDEVIDPEFDALFAGYAAGFNRYTRDKGATITNPDCAGADWIPTVTAEDIRRIHLTPAFLPNVGFLMTLASPPTPVAQAQGQPPARAAKEVNWRPLTEQDEARGIMLATLMDDINEERGSNGVAIGRELSEDGHGMLFTNPHLDWDDFTFRMYGLHQIIPGVTNMLGANQAQRANVGFGTNGEVAWTNTVSAGLFFSFFELELVPGNPMQYIFDGEVRDIEAVPVTIRVKDRQGNVSDLQHTFYRSHFGWLVGGALPWTETEAFAVRPADEGARGFQGGALAMSRAQTVRELKDIIARYGNFPSTNVIAADSSGEVLYGDMAPAPGLSDEQMEACATSSSGQLIRGNSSACEWVTDEDSAAPGLLGASKLPTLFRNDYVTNSNDSAWLANPNEPLEPLPRVKGDTGTERTMRTRFGLMAMEERKNGSDGLQGNTFNFDTFTGRLLGNDATAGLLLANELVTLCRANPTVKLETGPVDISGACEVLADWGRAYNLDDRGAHVFREFLRNARSSDDGRGAVPGALNVTMPFDPQDPVATPAGLDTSDNPVALEALATAVRDINELGIALDARLGDLQYVTLADERIPMHGGDEFEGVFNKMGMAPSDGEYPAVTGSSASWVMVTHVAGDNTRVRGLTAYSQSSDPTSANFNNMTKRFSGKNLPDIPFLLEDVEAAALSSTILTESAEDCAGEGWRQFSSHGVSDQASCESYFQSIYDSRITDFLDE